MVFFLWLLIYFIGWDNEISNLITKKTYGRPWFRQVGWYSWSDGRFEILILVYELNVE